MEINIRGVNSTIVSKTASRRIRNFVTCKCSWSMVEKVKQKIREAGAYDVKAGKFSNLKTTC